MNNNQQKSTIACANWDSFHPQPLTGPDGTPLGILRPRATQAELGLGIQGWSRPAVETRTDYDKGTS